LSNKNPECVKCGGHVKPDIVFFGEMLPDKFWIMQVTVRKLRPIFNFAPRGKL
jgi:NAD-dependent SIR2 family protein deacetylase